MSATRQFLSVWRRVKTPTILQVSETECGIAALAMVFAFYKVIVSMDILREKCGTSRDGCKAITLISVAKAYKFHANAYKVQVEHLLDLAEPVIAYWNFNHYVVINRISKNKVYINDPAFGAMTVSREEFDKSFTGVIIVVTPTAETKKIAFDSRRPQLLANWVAGFNQEIIFILLCLIITIIGLMFNSSLSAIFIDHCILARNTHWIPSLVAVSLCSFVIFTGAAAIQKWHQFKVITKASLIRSTQIIIHTLQLPMLFYSLRQKIDLISILARAETVINTLFKSGFSLFTSFLMVIVCFFVMVKINLLLAMITLGISFISLLIFLVISKHNLLIERSNLPLVGKFYSSSLSIIKNLETIKIGGYKDTILRKWFKLYCHKLMIQDKSNTIAIILNAISNFFSSLSSLAILCVGGWQISNGDMSIGRLMAYYAIYTFFNNSVNAIFIAFKDAQSAYVSFDRIQDVLSQQQDERFLIKEKKGINDASRVALACKDVYFHYNKTLDASLKNINVTINQGEHVALVGGTGSGKSTLAMLLCGLYRPSQGQVMLFQQGMESLTSADIASYTSYMSQEVMLFSGTILENLTLGQQTCSEKKISAAIKLACLTDVIHERGLKARVDENGSNFSGGEKQRIDIARALLQNTHVLIFDEATAALDVETEKTVILNLRSTNKTIVFVAHRLSTIKHCDKIFVLENGSIVEEGDHNSLIAKKGKYYALIMMESSQVIYAK